VGHPGHQGSITKTGNQHIRRVLVEAPGPTATPLPCAVSSQPGSRDSRPRFIAYSWAAQCRLHATYRKLAARKNANKAAVAVARELSGFVWGAMTGNMGRDTRARGRATDTGEILGHVMRLQ